jgi:hypothetical protein
MAAAMRDHFEQAHSFGGLARPFQALEKLSA